MAEKTRNNRSPQARDAGMCPEDLRCSSCGYALRGLSRDGNCPECGQSVQASYNRDVIPNSHEELARITAVLPLAKWPALLALPLCLAGAWTLWAWGPRTPQSEWLFRGLVFVIVGGLLAAWVCVGIRWRGIVVPRRVADGLVTAAMLWVLGLAATWLLPIHQELARRCLGHAVFLAGAGCEVLFLLHLGYMAAFLKERTTARAAKRTALQLGGITLACEVATLAVGTKVLAFACLTAAIALAAVAQCASRCQTRSRKVIPLGSMKPFGAGIM